MLKHDSIGCEHLLLAVVRAESGRAELIFKSLNTTAERTRARVVRSLGPGAAAASGEVGFTHEAKKALEFSLREALSLNHHLVGPEHILLGLLRKEEGLATRSLSLLDVDAEQLARAAKAIRIPPSSRLASMHLSYVAEFARLQLSDVRPPQPAMLNAPPRSPHVLVHLARSFAAPSGTRTPSRRGFGCSCGDASGRPWKVGKGTATGRRPAEAPDPRKRCADWGCPSYGPLSGAPT